MHVPRVYTRASLLNQLSTVAVCSVFCTSYNDTRTMIRVVKGGENHSTTMCVVRVLLPSRLPARIACIYLKCKCGSAIIDQLMSIIFVWEIGNSWVHSWCIPCYRNRSICTRAGERQSWAWTAYFEVNCPYWAHWCLLRVLLNYCADSVNSQINDWQKVFYSVRYCVR